jgi:hypothetical protein
VRFRDPVLVLALAALATAWASVACSDDPTSTSSAALCENSSGVTYENFGGPFLLNWCTGCHASDLPEGARQRAPVGVNLDSLDYVRAHSAQILERAVDRADMPPAGGPSARERELLAEWLRCGAPAESTGFSPPPPSDAGGPPKATGACAEPKQPLAASSLPRCSAATRACVEQCPLLSDDDDQISDCRDACIEADLTPPDPVTGHACNGCVFNELLACAASGGCADQSALLNCCIQECIRSQDATCLATRCADDLQAFGYCIYYGPIECSDYSAGPIARCFGS